MVKLSCFYCGAEPFQVARNSRSARSCFLYNGIDRVDNSIGYIDTNTVTSCGVCNNAKAVMSLDDFYLWIAAVYRTAILNGRISDG